MQREEGRTRGGELVTGWAAAAAAARWVAAAPRVAAVVANVVVVVAVAAATTMGCTRKRNVNVNVAPGCAK